MHTFVGSVSASFYVGLKSLRQRDHSIQDGWFSLVERIGNLDLGTSIPERFCTEPALRFSKCFPKCLLMFGCPD
jgi:hypothetical protein